MPKSYRQAVKLLPHLLSLSLPLQAAVNDDFAEATPISNTSGEIPFDLESTTIEPNESFSNGSVWFRWTPPGPGILSLSITPQNEGVTFFTNAYVGGSLQTLTPLGFGNSIFNFNGFVETVDPGEVVMIQIGKNSTTPNGDVGSLGIHFAPGPGNDSRLSPVFLGSLSGITIEPDNSQATRHRLDWLGTQSVNSGTLWYEWQPSESGFLYLHAQSSNFSFDSVVSIHRGDGGSTDEPIRTFEAGTSTKSIRISVLKEASYLISYSTDKRQTPGKSALSFQFLTPDPASEFSEAIDLSSQLPINVSASFRSATLDASVSYEATLDDPNSFPPAQSLWYSWEAPKDGFYRLTRTQGSTQLVLWKNNEESPPTFLEKNFNNQGVNFFVWLPVQNWNSFFVQNWTGFPDNQDDLEMIFGEDVWPLWRLGGRLVGDDPETVGLLDDVNAGAPARADIPLPAEETDLVCL